jgi:hypothetical protein
MKNTQKKQKNTTFSPNFTSFLAGIANIKDAGNMTVARRAV